jgi:dTDP-4-dehydrorhamnose reductase
MIRIALFGAGGQLGSELIAQAPRHAVELLGFTHGEADVADPTAVDQAIAAAQPHLIVNAASFTDVDRAETERKAAFRVNATGPAVLGKASAALRVPIVHISTDHVFDGTKTGAYREDDATAPLNVYGASKAEGEASLRQTNNRHLILRTSWVFGVHGRNFLRTVLRLASEKDVLSVVDDQFGCPTATVDLAEAIFRLAPLAAAGKTSWGTYHFAGMGVCSRYEFAREMVAAAAQVTGRHPAVKPIKSSEYPVAARRPANSALDCTRFTATFGFRAGPWQERMREAVAILSGAQA